MAETDIMFTIETKYVLSGDGTENSPLLVHFLRIVPAFSTYF